VIGAGRLDGYEAFDQLSAMVAIVRSDGRCLLANSTLEDTMAVSRRVLQRGSVFDWFVDPMTLRETLQALQRNEVSSGRFEALLKRAPMAAAEPLLVHVSVSQMEHVDCALLELFEIEQQTRQDREERALDSAQANKELLRNLAHEI
jgi:two-component system nitrogen regulation sensor histidine kinase GlnL